MGEDYRFRALLELSYRDPDAFYVLSDRFLGPNPEEKDWEKAQRLVDLDDRTWKEMEKYAKKYEWLGAQHGRPLVGFHRRHGGDVGDSWGTVVRHLLALPENEWEKLETHVKGYETALRQPNQRAFMEWEEAEEEGYSSSSSGGTSHVSETDRESVQTIEEEEEV